MSASKQDALKALQARGFGTFRRWERENLKGQRILRKRKKMDLVRALEFEMREYIRPNL